MVVEACGSEDPPSSEWEDPPSSSGSSKAVCEGSKQFSEITVFTVASPILLSREHYLSPGAACPSTARAGTVQSHCKPRCTGGELPGRAGDRGQVHALRGGARAGIKTSVIVYAFRTLCWVFVQKRSPHLTYPSPRGCLSSAPPM